MAKTERLVLEADAMDRGGLPGDVPFPQHRPSSLPSEQLIPLTFSHRSAPVEGAQWADVPEDKPSVEESAFSFRKVPSSVAPQTKLNGLLDAKHRSAKESDGIGNAIVPHGEAPPKPPELNGDAPMKIASAYSMTSSGPVEYEAKDRCISNLSQGLDSESDFLSPKSSMRGSSDSGDDRATADFDEAEQAAALKVVMGIFGSNTQALLGMCFGGWKGYATKVKSGEILDDDEEVEQIRDIAMKQWMPADDVIRRPSMQMAPIPEWCFNKSDKRAGSRSPRRRNSRKPLLTRMVARPSTKMRMVWDFMGFLCVCYDTLSIPFMVAFEVDTSPALAAISWLTTIFWTVDLPTNFFVGFHIEGIVEMRPAKVALNYVGSWFPIDGTVVLLDWVFIAVAWHGDQGMADVLRFGWAIRIFKGLRLLRLMRFAKLFPKILKLLEEVESDMVRLTLNLLRSVVVIIVICHFVACAWFAVGTFNDATTSTWTVWAGLEDDSDGAFRDHIEYKYLTSLHWAFCQFTPASMEVNPKNAAERGYAVCCIILGLVTFSSFVSSITSSMNQLRAIKKDRVAQDAAFHRYFDENEISVETGRCVVDWIRCNNKKQKGLLHEREIPGLLDVPARLKDQLRWESIRPFLTKHPFFLHFANTGQTILKRVCHSGISEVRVLEGQELFIKSQKAKGMYFVRSGSLSYYAHAAYGRTFAEGSWICEIALWANWVHRGTLQADRFSELFLLSAASFQDCIPKCPKSLRRFVRAYAGSFVRHECEGLSEGDVWLTDVCCDADLLRMQVHMATQVMGQVPSGPSIPDPTASRSSGGSKGRRNGADGAR